MTLSTRLLLYGLVVAVAFNLCCPIIFAEDKDLAPDQQSKASLTTGPEKIGNATNVVCGPHCVRYILDYYGKKDIPGIVAVTRSLQGKDIFKGAAMSALSGYLIEAGIQTTAVQLSSSAQLTWKYPVIVHLNSTGNSEMGHFVVWLPTSSRTEVQFWDHRRGVVLTSPMEWQSQQSGAVLLTAPTKINSLADVAVYGGIESDGTYARLLSGSVLLIGIAVCWITFFPNRARNANVSTIHAE